MEQENTGDGVKPTVHEGDSFHTGLRQLGQLPCYSASQRPACWRSASDRGLHMVVPKPS